MTKSRVTKVIEKLKKLETVTKKLDKAIKLEESITEETSWALANKYKADVNGLKMELFLLRKKYNF